MRALTAKPKLITECNRTSLVSEQYRTLRTQIRFSSTVRQVKTIAIASAQPKEGRSVTAANLAVAYAHEEKRVLLIDSDLRKPSLHQMLGVANRIGLSHVLSEQYAVEEAVVPSPIPNLSILTSGQIPFNPTELLGSAQMAAMLDKVYQQFDMVVLDTPPTLPVTDSQIIASLCDGVLFVVGYGIVKRGMAKKAISKLQFVNANLLGSILNKSTLSRAALLQ